MKLDVAIFLPMIPQGQHRHRVQVLHGRAQAYKLASDRLHERDFARLAMQHRPRDDEGRVVMLDEPVGLDLLFVMPRSSTDNRRSKITGKPLAKELGRRWDVRKPDVDNLQKTVLDAMVDWWRDDCIVVGVRSAKVVAAFGELCGYHVRIRDADAWMRPLGTGEEV
jgi:Holliday junction resolvase RusA-like endonuclease